MAETPKHSGRPSAGLTIAQWFEAMRGMPVEKVRAVAADPAAPVAAAAAAVAWLHASTTSGKPVPVTSLQPTDAVANGEGLTFVFVVSDAQQHRQRVREIVQN